MQELLANNQLVPGMRGCYVKVTPGAAIGLAELLQLTINHDNVEFMLSREVVRDGNGVTRRWRIYSGTPDQVRPPLFFDPNRRRIERVVAHTHPTPVPYDPSFAQPSTADLAYLHQIAADWRRVYVSQPEPFGRIIWGLNAGETTIYGLESTQGNAVPPRWLRRP
jgi:hypothetical protein